MKTKLLLAVAVLVFGVAAIAIADLIDTRTFGNSLLVESRVVSSVPCKAFLISGYNNSTNQLFVQIHPRRTAPTNGAIPLFSIPVPAGNFYSFDFSTYGADMTNGIAVCCSTTVTNTTLGGTNITVQAIISR